MRSNRFIHTTTAAVVLLGALQLAAAHGEEAEAMKMDMNSTSHDSTIPIWEDFQPSYFRHGHYTGWMLLHIAAMIISWIFVLPAAIMLSVARSRYHLPAQLVFHVINGFGIFAGFVYNHSTPDLYEVNAHHTMSWVVSALTAIWTLLSFCSAFNDWQSRRNTHTPADRPLLSPRGSGGYEPLPRYADRPSISRFSHDSGMFSDSRASSSDSVPKKQEQSTPPEEEIPLDDYDHTGEERGFVRSGKVDRILSQYSQVISFAASTIRLSQIVLEKFLLLLGFAAIATGFVTYGGIFRSDAIFSGLAHYIKGAIFFWYGLLTLGRWMGAFSEFGWAWNIRPQQPLVAKWKTMMPSAEFTESFVIWFYGASNVFLEHLGKDNDDFSPQDFEHVSITVLFFGGGLLGMLIESRWMRNLMSTQVELQKSDMHSVSRQQALGETGEAEEWMPCRAERTSMNPMPAVVIMLLGMMMSSHHQLSMVSTMMHKSWGTLFTGFAMSRLMTYVLMYLKPPTSHYPARPPTELIAAFCLTSGGIMFMNSAGDSVRSIETNGFDAMTVFTITMGLTGIIMAWTMACFALKGWAQRKERLATGRPLP